MRVIAKARLRAIWEEPGHEDAEGPLRAWHTHVSSKTVSWQSWGDVKADFRTASSVGNCVVFNIAGQQIPTRDTHLVSESKGFHPQSDGPFRIRRGQMERGMRLF